MAVQVKPSAAGEPCTRDIRVENVHMTNGYGAAIGSVSTGCVERVSFRNLTIDNAGCAQQQCASSRHQV